MTRGRTARFCLPLAAAVLLTGCAGGGAPAQPGPALPPRPAELRLDHIDPCTLLTRAQKQQLGLRESGGRGVDGDGLGSPDCVWTAQEPTAVDNSWLVRTVTKRGAGYALSSAAGAKIEQIAGFPAVQSWSDRDDPRFHCIYLIDVAQGQHLWVQYNNYSRSQSDLTPELACQRDRQVAEMTMRNLVALAAR